MKIIRQLSNQTTLTVETQGNGYIATLSSDNRNLGVDDDCGTLPENEELENIADRLQMSVSDLIGLFQS